MRTRIAYLAGAGLVAALGAVAIGQDQRPVFRSSLDLVQIDVSVLDGQRRPVAGLTATDFTILEDGQTRPVKGFAAVTLPPRPAASDPAAVWASAAPPDVVTNEVGEQGGRLVIILMDRTIPPGQPTLAARKIAETTIASLGPQDLAAVVSTSGGVPQAFTADHARLLKAVGQRDWSTDVSQEAKEILGGLSADLAPDRLSDGRCLCGLCVLDTVTHLANAVRSATGRRKLLFFIGSSLVVQAPARAPSADVGCDRLLRDARNQMFDALERSSLTIHALDPQGLSSVGPQTRASTPNNGVGPGAPAARRQQQQQETNEVLRDQDELGILPQKTGGRRIVNTNAPEEKVPDIFHESESYYVLAYEPGPATRGPAHTLEVKVARKGVHVYTQSRVASPPVVAGARGASASPTAQARVLTLGEALGGLLPLASRSLSMNLAAAAGIDDDRPTVSIHVDALSFLEGRTTSAPLEVRVVALDAFSRQVASATQTSVVTLAGTVAGRPPEAPIESRLDLLPGDYEIRVAVRDPESGSVSSVFAPIAVPAFASAPLSLSDVAIKVAQAGPSTIRRVFRASEQIAATGFVYERLDRDDIVPVAVQAQVVDASGRVVQGEALTLSARDFVRHRAEIRVPIPLAQLSPGAYLFRLETAAGAARAVKAVRFVVEAN